MRDDPSAPTPELKGHPWFAAAYDPIMRWGERRLLGRLRRLVVGEATGRVLEIGTGTGANFPYYQAAEQIVATDPDPFMLRRARKRAEELGLDVEFHQCPAEKLPFADFSFDTVVATLVLCTVRDQARSLEELRRVLKAGGTFRFIEHVRAERAPVARVQDVLTPAWRRLGAGCHLNRRTVENIQTAGFEIVQMRQHGTPLGIPFVAGVARPCGRRAGGHGRKSDDADEPRRGGNADIIGPPGRA